MSWCKSTYFALEVVVVLLVNLLLVLLEVNSGGSFAVEVGEFVAGFGEFGGGTFVGGNVGGSFGLEVVGGTAVLRSSSAA